MGRSPRWVVQGGRVVQIVKVEDDAQAYRVVDRTHIAANSARRSLEAGLDVDERHGSWIAQGEHHAAAGSNAKVRCPKQIVGFERSPSPHGEAGTERDQALEGRAQHGATWPVETPPEEPGPVEASPTPQMKPHEGAEVGGPKSVEGELDVPAGAYLDESGDSADGCVHARRSKPTVLARFDQSEAEQAEADFDVLVESVARRDFERTPPSFPRRPSEGPKKAHAKMIGGDKGRARGRGQRKLNARPREIGARCPRGFCASNETKPRQG